MNNKRFDPFTLYPDFAYPETVSLANPEIRWTNETTEQYLGCQPDNNKCYTKLSDQGYSALSRLHGWG